MKRKLLSTAMLAGGVSCAACVEVSAAEPGGHEGHAGHAMTAPAALPADANAEEAARAPGPGEHAGHGGADRYVWLRLDQLEAADTDDGTATAWQGGVSWGTNLDRLWLTSEGSREDGKTDDVETQLYWTHAFRRWWDTTLGLRRDTGPGDSRTWAAAGLRGLAPYWFETAATLFVSDDGQTALRLEGDYELLLTNRLILQPEVELNFYGKDDPAGEWGEGPADSTVGLRLRYEIRRKFAPYIGVEWRRLHGQTADLAGAAGERAHDGLAVAGVRVWY